MDDISQVGRPLSLAAIAADQRTRTLGPDRIPGLQVDCCAGGWVTVDQARPGSVRPCETCRPEAHARWAEGCWDPFFSPCPGGRSRRRRGNDRLARAVERLAEALEERRAS